MRSGRSATLNAAVASSRASCAIATVVGPAAPTRGRHPVVKLSAVARAADPGKACGQSQARATLEP